MKISISKEIDIKADEIVTGRTCVIGQSGSGKSYTVAVICEELAKNNVGFCIIDLEGEYFSLKEKYPILWIGTDPNADIDITNVNMKKLAAKLASNKFPAIFDVSEVDNPKEIVKEFLKEIYQAETKLKNPYLLIIEEIDKFAPQKGKSLYEVEEISRRGRKRGLGLMIATQRPALVNKNVLSQCGNQIIGKLTIKNDLDSVRIFFPDKNQLNSLPELKQGQFFVMGNIGNGELTKTRKRITTHKATTPMLVQKKSIKIADLKNIEAEIENIQEEQIEEKTEKTKKEIIEPVFSKEQAYEKIMKKTKQFVLFGETANISNLHLSLRPIYSIEIKYLKKNILGNEFLNIHTYFDTITGNLVSTEKGYKQLLDLSEFIGLNQIDLEIFDIISISKGKTATTLSYDCNCSEHIVKKAILKLKERQLVTHKKQGRSTLYIPFTKKKLPEIKKLLQKEVVPIKLTMSAKVQKEVFTIKEFKEFVKGLVEESDITKYQTVYYPFYTANATRGKKSWKVTIDAISGKLF